MINAGTIREHMEVVGSDGAHVGTVDHMEGEDRVKLTKNDSPDGEHHYLSVDMIDSVDDKVRLNVPADEAREAFH